MKDINDGFINDCAPLMIIDCYYWKGPYEGVFLATVGLDKNNGLFLVTYTIVKAENNDS